jgi:hypothetical protein
MPIPADPRTPEQRIQDQLAAAHRQLTAQGLSRSERAAIADRIHDLTDQARRAHA